VALDANKNIDGEFVGRFDAGTKIEVDANALLDLLNANLSGQTHRVLELFVLRNHHDSAVRKLHDDVLKHTVASNGITLEEPQDGDEVTLEELVSATKERQGSVLNDFVGDMMDIVSVYPKSLPIRNLGQAEEIDIAGTYPTAFPSGFMEWEIVKRKDGNRFFLGGEKFVEFAVLVKSRPEHGLLFLGTTDDFSLTWTAPIELLDDVESTGTYLHESLKGQMIAAYETLVGRQDLQ